MAIIVNQTVLGGGFRHYSGLLPAVLGGGDPFHASVDLFAVPAANAAAIYRGDIVVFAFASIGTQGGSDIIPNIGPPAAAAPVIGNAGGSQLGNASIAPNISRMGARRHHEHHCRRCRWLRPHLALHGQKRLPVHSGRSAVLGLRRNRPGCRNVRHRAYGARDRVQSFAQ